MSSSIGGLFSSIFDNVFAFTANSLTDLFKAVLAKSLSKSGCQLQESDVDKIAFIVLDEVKAIGSRFGKDISTDDALEIIAAAQAANRTQKFAHDASCNSGRYSRMSKLKSCVNRIEFSNETVDNENLVDGLAKYVGKIKTEYHPCLGNIIRRRSDKLQLSRLIDADMFESSKCLQDNGLVPNTSYWTDGHELETAQIAIVEGAGGNLKVEGIKIFLHGHNPAWVKISPGSQWTRKTFNFRWKFSDSDTSEKSVFSYIHPSSVDAQFAVDLEFAVRQEFSVPPWAAWLSLGVNALVFNTSFSGSWNFNGIHLKVTCDTSNNDLPFEPREKLVIVISESTAVDFLKTEAQLLYYKQQLGQEEEIKRLTGSANIEDLFDPNMELDSLIQLLQDMRLVQAEQAAKMQEGSDEATKKMAGTGIDYADMISFLQQMKCLDQNSVGAGAEAAREALMAMIQTKSTLINTYPDFKSLIASGNGNNLLGLAFEEIVAGRIQTEALKHGIELERIMGDGNGVLPNGQPTPQHCDLVFRDKSSGKLFSSQMKFTDDPSNVGEMVNKFVNTHSGKGNPSGYPELSLDNTEIIVPSGMETKNIKVNVNGTPKTFEAKNEINIGKIKVKTPTVEEMNKFLEKNFGLLKKINQENFLETHKNLMDKRTGIPKYQNALERQKAAVENMPEGDAKKQLLERIEDTKKQLDNLETQLKENQQKLEEMKKETSTVTRQDQRIWTKQLLKQVAFQCAVSAAVGAITSFVISFDQNLSKYKKGEMSLAQFCGRLAKDTGKAAAYSAAFTGGVSLASAVCRHMATSSSTAIRLTGTWMGRLMGPAILVGAIGIQATMIIKQYSAGEITSCERNKLMSRMIFSTSAGVGGSIAAACLLTGPAGWLVGAGACISVALLDYFLGDKIASWFFKEDPDEVRRLIQAKHEKIEQELIEKAYKMFDLTRHCTDEELKDSYRAAVLKYHPDKCRGSDAEKKQNEQITQAIVAAYTFLKELRQKNK